MPSHPRSIQELLESYNIFATMFDALRLVDPEKGILLEYGPDGAIRETGICCTDVFGSNERCRNCTSTRAYYADKTMVKLEYAGGAVLLIHSIPIAHNGHRVIVEMVKDISDSMTMDVKDKQRLDSVTSIINDLNQMATTDVLTGLFNRRYLDEHLATLVESCQRIGEPLCVALLDLDDFKAVNDRHGHRAGDQVLRASADSVSSFIRRGSDWAARYGGEELFACFVGVRLPDGAKILERVRQHIEENLVVVDGNQGVTVTASIGVAELGPGEGMEALLRRCDRLLYQAKRKGKNRVEYLPDPAFSELTVRRA